MKVNAMAFKQGDDGAIPSMITVTMTLAEAVWIGKAAGRTSGEVSSHIYATLTGDVFNRFWDNGIDGAAPAGEGGE
jgi:hypothetical protein